MAVGAFLALVALGAIYALASVPGALWRPGPQLHTPHHRYPIFLTWSDIHTDILLPTRGLSVDWSTVLTDPDAPYPPARDGYIAFGWGSESFYTRAPTMADISPQLIARALFFDATVVHTAPFYDPLQIPPAQRLTMLISDEELMALEQFVLGTLVLDAEGRADALPESTYGYGDAFYRAHGRYNPVRTCNQWTSEALRLAGIPAGYWTPFIQSITWVLGTDADAIVSP